MIAVVGIDPGGRHTGLVARRGDVAVWAAVITRDSADVGLYLMEIRDGVGDAIDLTVTGTGSYPLIAVEGLTAPSPHMGVISLQGLLDTAVVLGAVRAWWPGVIVVPPGDNGAGPLSSYPGRLVGARERKGEGMARHARSAWDVAGKAELYRALPR